jgi:hypothetical protein
MGVWLNGLENGAIRLNSRQNLEMEKAIQSLDFKLL